MPSEITDNRTLDRFEMPVDGAVAFITYRLRKSVTVLVHTEVPKALEGRGIGSRLAKGVLDRLHAEKRKIVVICEFLTHYIRKHPEYLDMLAAPLRNPDHDHLDSRLDEALAETFPASDPLAVTPEHR